MSSLLWIVATLSFVLLWVLPGSCYINWVCMKAPFLYCILLIDASSAMVHFLCSVIMHCGMYNIAYLLTSLWSVCFPSSALKLHSFIRKGRQNFINIEFCAIRMESAMFVKFIFTFLLKDIHHFRVKLVMSFVVKFSYRLYDKVICVALRKTNKGTLQMRAVYHFNSMLCQFNFDTTSYWIQMYLFL